jgi:hypothetical protein
LSDKNSLKTWAFLIGLIIFGGLATVVWQAGIAPSFPSGSSAAPAPQSGQPEMVEIRIHETNALLMDISFLANLDGRQYSPFSILGFLTLITVLPIVLVGGGLALALRLGDNQTNSVKESEAVKQAQVALTQRETEQIKALRQGKQPKPRPASHDMPRWSLVSTILIAIMFVFFTGTLMGGYLPEGGRLTPAMLNWSLIILSAGILVWLFRGDMGQRLYRSDDQEDAPIPWGWIWVIVSGLLVVGLGLGFSIAMLPG